MIQIVAQVVDPTETMLQLKLSPRGWQRIVRRLDLACVLLLTLNISYMTLYALSSTDRAIRSEDGNMPSDRRKCQSVIFRAADIDIVQQSGDILSLVDRESQPEIETAGDGSFQRQMADGEGHGNQVTNINICPEFPTNLKGELVCACDPVSPEVIVTSLPRLEKGGRLRPSTCKARERLAIIIPFRNRTSQLHILLSNLLPVLDRQNADVTIFVIEQTSPTMFNRATLHNIGFLESQKVGSFDCYIFHDVDLIPLDDRILYRCSDNPRHFAVSIKRYPHRQAKPMYDEYYGGIVALTSNQYRDLNGNSNLYFGWGGEDDDLRLRVINKGYETAREDQEIFRFEMLNHERNDRTRGNIDRVLLLRTAEDRQDFEGLSTTKYKVLETHLYNLYVWVSVSLNMTELLLTAPDFALSSIKSLLEISKTIT